MDYPSGISLEEALAQVGLAGFEEVPTRALSAGQQRRVALARLLLKLCSIMDIGRTFHRAR